MALHPVGDTVKVRLIEKSSLMPDTGSDEMGIVVEVPEAFHYFGKHSLILESSFLEDDKLEVLRRFFKSLIGKKVFWEARQDLGRRFKEDGTEFVILKASDILAYSDETNEDVESAGADRAGGSFSM